MKRAIIESPYAGDIDRNTLYARRAMRHAIEQGYSPIASHLTYNQPGILDEFNPDERRLGIECGYAWWEVAEEILFYTDYGYSPGMIAARKRCYETGRLFHELKIGENP